MRERGRSVIHVDLDGARHIYRAHGWTWPHRDDTIFTSGLRRTLDVLEQRRLVATLFVIAEDLDDPVRRALVVEAHQRGHEIASHTRTHRHLTTLPPDERRRELAESRQAIERIVGARVLGFRAPGFQLDQATLGMLAETGYRYDSSVFAGDRAPRGALCALPDVNAPPGLTLLRMPGYAGLPWPFHPSYSLLLGTRYFRAGFERALQSPDQPFVLLMHLTDLADPLPAASLHGWKSRLFTLSILPVATKMRRLARILDLVQDRCTVVSTASLLPAEAS